MRMTITNNTSMADIARELQQTNANERLRAKYDANGDIVLYSKVKDSSVKGIARSIGESILAKVGLSFDKKRFAQVLIRSTIRHDIQNDKVASAPLRKAVKQSEVVYAKLSRLLEFGAKQFDKNASNKVGNVATTLSKLVEMREIVHDTLRPFQNVTKEDVPPLPPTQNRALNSSVQLTYQGGNGTATRDFPDLQIDGKTFKARAVLGEGGEGLVVSYKADDDDTRAVKFLKFEDDNLQAHRDNAANELHLARTMTQGNAGASGFTDFVNLADNTVALIGEPLPNGDLAGMGEKLHAALVGDLPKNTPVPTGKITPFEKNLIALTLIKDAATGLAIINEGKDSIHGDMKSQNVMIDRDGKARLIDFGKSAKSSEVVPLAYSFPDNPLYIAPEVQRMEREAKARFHIPSGELRTLFNKTLENVLDGFKSSERTKQTHRDGLGDLARDLANGLTSFTTYADGLDTVAIDKSRIDTYGLGTVGVELAIGGRLTQSLEEASSFQTVVQDNIDQWAQTGHDALGPNGLRDATSGDTQIDSLLNDMLRGDPKDRLSTTEVRDHPIMSRAGVGSPEVRALIKALASGDASQIDQARDALRNRFMA